MEDSRGNPGHQQAQATTTVAGGRVAEALARMGVAVEAQRSELYEQRDDVGMSLVGWWTALGHDVDIPLSTEPLPLSWFPWSLGNIRPSSHVLVRNAGPLQLRPDSDLVVADLGMGSALHLPVHDGFKVVGAACIYWADERDDWAADRYERVVDFARDVLY